MKTLALKSKAVNTAQVNGGCGVCSDPVAIMNWVLSLFD